MRTIETAGMDGSDRKVLAVVNMEEPVGLTLDHVMGRLYWIDHMLDIVLPKKAGESVEQHVNHWNNVSLHARRVFQLPVSGMFLLLLSIV